MLVERMVSGSSPFDRDMFTQEMVRENVMFRGTPPTAVGLGRILGKTPFNCEAQKGQGDVRYLVWRNIDQWRNYKAFQRAEYVQSGVRPAGTWTDAVPDNIQDMSADGSLDTVAAEDVDSGVSESIAEFF